MRSGGARLARAARAQPWALKAPERSNGVNSRQLCPRLPTPQAVWALGIWGGRRDFQHHIVTVTPVSGLSHGYRVSVESPEPLQLLLSQVGSGAQL